MPSELVKTFWEFRNMESKLAEDITAWNDPMWRSHYYSMRNRVLHIVQACDRMEDAGILNLSEVPAIYNALKEVLMRLDAGGEQSRQFSREISEIKRVLETVERKVQ